MFLTRTACQEHNHVWLKRTSGRHIKALQWHRGLYDEQQKEEVQYCRIYLQMNLAILLFIVNRNKNTSRTHCSKYTQTPSIHICVTVIVLSSDCSVILLSLSTCITVTGFLQRRFGSGDCNGLTVSAESSEGLQFLWFPCIIRGHSSIWKISACSLWSFVSKGTGGLMCTFLVKV